MICTLCNRKIRKDSFRICTLCNRKIRKDSFRNLHKVCIERVNKRKQSRFVFAGNEEPSVQPPKLCSLDPFSCKCRKCRKWRDESDASENPQLELVSE